MTEDPDGGPLVDRRRPPFCYQTLDAVNAIRACVAPSRLPSTLGIYLVLTEVANEKGGASARDGFRATRKEIAARAGVSPDTLDRYARELEDAGVVKVERQRFAGSQNVSLPNIWVLVDPCTAAPPSRSPAAGAAQGGSRTGAALKGKELITSQEQEPPIAPPANRPSTVNRRTVKDDEYSKASAILAAFNAAAGTSYSSGDWIAKIISRLREHPELTVEAHEIVIRRAFLSPWWNGEASPSVVYGNAALFERNVHAVRQAPPDRPLTPEEMESYG